MRKFLPAAKLKTTTLATAAIALAAGAGVAVGFADTAAAAPSSTGSAADTVGRLQDEGYNVALNGPRTAPLSECIVTGIHPGDPGSVKPAQFTTVYVDISCPSTNN